MTMYDVMYEAINEQYENGEITFEQAEELNELAYDKYVIETSKSTKEKRDRLYYKNDIGVAPKGKEKEYESNQRLQKDSEKRWGLNQKDSDRNKRSFRHADRSDENLIDYKTGRRSMKDEPMIQNIGKKDDPLLKITPKSGSGNKYWGALKKIDHAGYPDKTPDNKKYSERRAYTNLSDTYTRSSDMSWPEQTTMYVSYKKRDKPLTDEEVKDAKYKKELKKINDKYRARDKYGREYISDMMARHSERKALNKKYGKTTADYDE